MSVNNRYSEIIEELTAERPLPTLQERKDIIEEINEDYFKETGEQLPNNLLTKLADWYLADELGNKDKYKMEKEEYPILTEPQAKRRRRQVVLLENDTMDYFDNVVKKPLQAQKGKVVRS